jgi:hypothetical protein
MSTDQVIHEGAALLRLALYCWGGCLLGAVLVGYVLGGLGNGRDSQ